jgi:hypothetical protein
MVIALSPPVFSIFMLKCASYIVDIVEIISGKFIVRLALPSLFPAEQAVGYRKHVSQSCNSRH